MCIYIYNILPRIDEWTTMIGTTSRIQLVAIAHNNYEHTNKTKKTDSMQTNSDRDLKPIIVHD